MDEPFGALDAITRRNLQIEIKQLWSRTGKTIIFVTHDISESLLLGTDMRGSLDGTGCPRERSPCKDRDPGIGPDQQGIR